MNLATELFLTAIVTILCIVTVSSIIAKFVDSDEE